MAVPTPKTIPSRLSSTPIVFAFAAAPTVETDMVWMPGDELIAFNSSADTAYTITVRNRPYGKAAAAEIDITGFSLPFGTYYILPRFPRQEGDVLKFLASNAAIKFARLSTRAQPA